MSTRRKDIATVNSSSDEESASSESTDSSISKNGSAFAKGAVSDVELDSNGKLHIQSEYLLA